ncbi:apical endosomal glycoprotein [Xyrauchen texanus]|uniref:apical endosomal glycoprotein n=1 Tax=Xyrauchen texanus TaxID=154827 RepID=UPI0022424315|nr:apical endosomal glycoprotein [Xyrauchen texanus]
MVLSHRIFLLGLVLHTCQWAIALERVDCNSSPEDKCDFVCDCKDCTDEQDCGYLGRDFVCDFEHEGMCGWTDQSDEGAYMWQRQQRENTLPDSGPSSDYTTGTSTGWFMAVTAVTSDTPRTAVLESPKINQSAPTCRLRLRYFIWDSGHTGLGDTPLWGSVWQTDGEQAVVWRPESSSIRGWREATIYLGRILGPFHIRFHSRRSEGRQGDMSIDQLEFLDCALPIPPESGTCSPGFLKCKRGGCLEYYKVCDGTDDCGDGTDEENCEQYMSCNFEDDLCDWDLRPASSLKWIKTNQMNISLSEPLKGPGRDHSTNTMAGHFLYVTKPDVLKSDWANFQSPPLAPTNHTHPCRMVMYTHQFGPVSGGLAVLVAERQIYPVWERGGSHGDLWVKNEVEFVVNSTFQILFVAAIRDKAYGGIAVDDIVLSPECRLTNESMPVPIFPKPPARPCTEDSHFCDFEMDCSNAEDEAQCGDFSYEKGSSGWTDTSIGSQAWELMLEYNDSIKVEFLFLTSAPGQHLSEAQTRTPLLGPSGPACSLQFSYRLNGNNTDELSVYVVDSVLGTQPVLWEFSGRTNEMAGIWLKENVYIGARNHRFQLEFRARAQEISPSTQIAVKDVYYFDCHPQYIPSGDLSCNFEVNLCGWYQDQNDNYDWRIHSGMDHTIHDGSSLVVNMWDPLLRGLSGRLLSVKQESFNTEHCLTFFYKLYGPDTGALAVKLLFADGTEEVLWMSSGAHGNIWHEGHCPVPPQLTAFQLVIESIRSGFDGQLALDDVAFVSGSCSLPTMCSFESQTCGYTSSGKAKWIHQNWASAKTGPKTDHSLDTEKGFYMLAHSGADVLPLGSVMTLTSPVRSGLSHTECVHFWYYTGGDNPGTLKVYVKPSDGDSTMLFSSSFRLGHAWHRGQGNVSWHGDWQLQFEVEGGGGKESYTAIDDITYSTHSCPTTDSVCDLERGLCEWSNTQNPSLDWLDWDLNSAQAETFYSTPPNDNTLHTEEGHFLFLPNSHRDTASQNAWLLSPHMEPTNECCLSFWVYQPTLHDSKLIVWRLSEGGKHELLTLDEEDGGWKHFRVNITSETEYQIVFEGFKGQKGFLALDDIKYTVGVNCAMTDQKPSPSSNTGAIVASVIVVILLLIVLSALLVYYLKTKERSDAIIQDTSHVACNGFGNVIYESSSTEHVAEVDMKMTT